ncbi:MAG: hypothetical protein ACLFR8_03875 [Alkalispirochaeta sp.]
MITPHIRRIAVVLLIGVGAATVAAQSNDRVDELLGQDPAELGHSAYLVLSAAGVVDETATPDEALQSATAAGLVPSGTEVTRATDFGDLSYLLMEAFGEPGGLMYRIIPGRRYAAREVVYQGWSRTRYAPGEALDGESVVRILSVYLNERGGDR